MKTAAPSTSDTAAFAIGERRPHAAFAPQTLTALAKMLETCSLQEDAVVFFGGGTTQSLGNAPSRYTTAISLCALDRLVTLEPADGVVTVQAGMRASELARLLEAHRLFCPLDVPLAGRRTVGGVLATGWAGPRRLTYGRPRDLLRGATLVLADGTFARSGATVAKNVSGYDTATLAVGSLGTLAAVAVVSLTAIPLPPARRLFIAPLERIARERALALLGRFDPEPQSAIVIDGGDDRLGVRGEGGRLVASFAGSLGAMDRLTRDLRSAFGASGIAETLVAETGIDRGIGRALDVPFLGDAEGSLVYRSVGRPTEAHARIEAFHVIARRHGLAAVTTLDLRCGDVMGRVQHGGDFESRAVAFDEELAQTIDRCALLRAPARLRARLRPYALPEETLAPMRALKATFDPAGMLAPGRIMSDRAT